MVKEKSIGGIIFREENKERFYLLLEYERINDQEGEHNYWDFPKGHQEEKESEITTLFREIKEETSLTDVNLILGFKESIRYIFKKNEKLINKEVIFYLLKTENKQINISGEHTNFKWANYKEALKLINFKSSKEIIKKAEEFINNSLLKYN